MSEKTIVIKNTEYKYNDISELIGVLMLHKITIGSRVTIGDFISIGSGVEISAGVEIGAGVKIGKRVTIGDGVKIGEYVTIREYTYIGDGAKIGRNSNISEHTNILVNVEIGAFSCVHRYAGIDKNSKLPAFFNLPSSMEIPANCHIIDYKAYYMPELYKYSILVFTDQHGTITVGTGCVTKTLKDWDKDFGTDCFLNDAEETKLKRKAFDIFVNDFKKKLDK